jgi:hypothetical protein
MWRSQVKHQLASEMMNKAATDLFPGRSLVYRSRPEGFILYSLGLTKKMTTTRGCGADLSRGETMSLGENRKDLVFRQRFKRHREKFNTEAKLTHRK